MKTGDAPSSELQNVRVEGVEIFDVVLDVAEPVFAGHPARADVRVRVRFAGRFNVESRERLGRDDEALRRGDRLEVTDEAAGELSVAVTDEPELPNARVRLARREVAGRA